MKIRSFIPWAILLLFVEVSILLEGCKKASLPNVSPSALPAHEHEQPRVDGNGGHTHAPAPGETMQVHYQGRVFVVDRVHPDYNAEQVKEIKAIITNEKPPLLFQSYKALMDYYRQLKAPGFGGSTGGFGEKTTLGQFTFITVEIPKHQRFRTFILRRQGEQKPYHLFDEFYYHDRYAPLFQFVVDDRTVSYIHQIKGKIIRAKDIGNL